MCKVVIKKPEERVGFIMYNHLYTRNDDSFTVPQLTSELKQYHLNLTPEEVQREIDSFLCDGLVTRNFNGYTRTAML